MVTYLPTTASRSITVLTAEVGTKLGINAPAEVIQGVSFEIFGSLQRIDTMDPLDGEEIELWVDDVFVSSMLTTIIGTPVGPAYGAYQFFHSLADTGPHTLEVRFLGSVRPGLILGASKSLSDMAVTGVDIPALIRGLVAPILVGGTLVYLGK